MTTPPANVQLARLTTLVEGMDERMQEDRAARSEELKTTAATRAAMQAELQRLAAKAESMDARLSKVEPVTDMVTGWKFMAAGAAGLIAIFGGAMIGFLKFIGVSLAPPP